MTKTLGVRFGDNIQWCLVRAGFDREAKPDTEELAVQLHHLRGEGGHGGDGGDGGESGFGEPLGSW